MFTAKEKSPLLERFSSEEYRSYDATSRSSASLTQYQRAIVALVPHNMENSSTKELEQLQANQNVYIIVIEVGSGIQSISQQTSTKKGEICGSYHANTKVTGFGNWNTINFRANKQRKGKKLQFRAHT